jgi:hypothetical protein
MSGSHSLSQRFIEGLQQFNISYKEIIDGGWKYCGGNREGRHQNYYKMVFPNKRLPEKKDYCVCGHAIKENCYITNETYVLVLGNCCIKRFMPGDNSGRTCSTCGKSHKNRIVNRCKECRKGVCDKCDKRCNPSYKLCYDCWNDKTTKP